MLCGYGGNDVLLGKGGNDVLIGGPGQDTASYAGSATAITANLSTWIATGQGSDTLEGMERVTGGLKADKITGDAAANTLSGRWRARHKEADPDFSAATGTDRMAVVSAPTTAIRAGPGKIARPEVGVQNGYSSLRQLRGSSGCGFGARSSSISK